MSRFTTQPHPCRTCGGGTANHETTTGCLMSMAERLEASRDNFLQVEAELAAATARAEAAEAKVRDVETLLGWLRPDTELIFRLGLNYERTIAVVEEWKERDDAKVISWCHWDNESAVSAAAQWVRENSPPQKKPTDDGGRGGEDGGADK